MKRKILKTLLCVMIVGVLAFPMMACSRTEIQVVKEEVIYNASGGVIEKENNTYDANGNLIQNNNYEIVNNKLTLKRINKYTYNDNNDITLYEYYVVDDNDENNQTLTSKTVSEYNGKLLKTEYDYRLNTTSGECELETKTEYTYDNKDRVLTELIYDYDVDEEIYTKKTINEYTYEGDFKHEISKKTFLYNNGEKASNPSFEYTYTLNDKGEAIFAIYKIDYMIIVDISALSSVFNDNGDVVTEILYDVDTDTNEYFVTTVIANVYEGDYKAETTFRYFDDGVLTGFQKNLYEYDDNHNVTKFSILKFNFNTNEFEVEKYTTYTYETIVK